MAWVVSTIHQRHILRENNQVSSSEGPKESCLEEEYEVLCLLDVLVVDGDLEEAPKAVCALRERAAWASLRPSFFGSDEEDGDIKLVRKLNPDSRKAWVHSAMPWSSCLVSASLDPRRRGVNRPRRVLERSLYLLEQRKHVLGVGRNHWWAPVAFLVYYLVVQVGTWPSSHGL